MLAIVIPYYKINFFEILLDSLSKQTNKNFNVYIGNDASPDNPLALIKTYQKKLNISYTFFKENLGGQSLVSQWDRCIALTKDEKWIMILGDDDYLEPNVIEAFYKNHEIFKHKTNLVRFATKTEYIETKTKTKTFTHPIWETAEDSFYRKFKGKTRSSLSEFVFLKSVYNKFKFTEFPLAWHSDDKAWLDFSNHLPIYTINGALVIIAVSNVSITGMSNNKMQKFNAQRMFYYALLKNKHYNFSINILLDIISAYEHITARLGAIKLKDWWFINIHYLKVGRATTVLKFYKRTIRRILKN